VLPKDKKHIAYNKEFKVKTTKSSEVLKAVLTNLLLKLKKRHVTATAVSGRHKKNSVTYNNNCITTSHFFNYKFDYLLKK
jgi:hypothetical protein